MSDYTRNYMMAGGKSAFSKYYTTSSTQAHLDPTLKKQMVLSTHNLVTDGVFNEFHLILCRNVLIYFDDQLSNQVLHLLHDSLANRGHLVLGPKESIRFHRAGQYFENLHNKYKVFRRL